MNRLNHVQRMPLVQFAISLTMISVHSRANAQDYNNLWGLENDPDQLFLINRRDASSIPCSTLSVPIAADVGLAYDPLMDVFYAVDGNGFSPGSTVGLLVIDRSGDTEIRCPTSSGSCISVEDPGLGFDPERRKLYMVTDLEFKLYEIELDTGLPILIGDTQLSSINGNVGVAYDTTRDTLFMVRLNDVNLYRLDVTTGEASKVGRHGVSMGGGLNSLAYDPDTDLLYSLSGNPGIHLYSLHPDTAAAEDIGPTSFNNMEGLAVVLGLNSLPGVIDARSISVHRSGGALPIHIDLAATVEMDSGAVTTETRDKGVIELEIDFQDRLCDSVAELGPGAVDIAPDPPIDPPPDLNIRTTLLNDNHTLRLQITPRLPDEHTYTVTLTDAVIAESVATPGDRNFVIRALECNVCSESGPGPQVVNAFDLGLSCGVRSQFGQTVDETTAKYDVNQDGAINALDFSAIRFFCFTKTAP